LAVDRVHEFDGFAAAERPTKVPTAEAENRAELSAAPQ